MGVYGKAVATTLNWISGERVNIPNETFLRLEIEAIRERERRLRESLDQIEEAKKWSKGSHIKESLESMTN